MEPEDAPRLQQRFHTVHGKPVCARAHTRTHTLETNHTCSQLGNANISYSSSLKEATEG